jgi:hypothetical protein
MFLIAGVDPLGGVAGKEIRLNFSPETLSTTGMQSSSVAPG